MNHLAHCVLHYAQCLWETQALLAPHAGEPTFQNDLPGARHADHYQASLALSIAALPQDQRDALARAARRGWPLREARDGHAEPVREALMAGNLPPPPRPLPGRLRPWRDPSLAAITLRGLRYALDMADALPDPETPPHAGSPLVRTARAVDEQQARLWDAVEAITPAEAGELAAAAAHQADSAPAGTQHADLLAYFASGIFVERLKTLD